jgi:hypothetical protein
VGGRAGEGVFREALRERGERGEEQSVCLWGNAGIGATEFVYIFGFGTFT